MGAKRSGPALRKGRLIALARCPVIPILPIMGRRTDTPPPEELLTLKEIAAEWGLSLPALHGRRKTDQLDFDRGSTGLGTVSNPRRWPRSRVDELRADPRFGRALRPKRRAADLDALALRVREEDQDQGEEGKEDAKPDRDSSPFALDPDRPCKLSVTLILTCGERAALLSYPQIYGVSVAELVRSLLLRRLKRSGFLPDRSRAPELSDPASDGD